MQKLGPARGTPADSADNRSADRRGVSTVCVHAVPTVSIIAEPLQSRGVAQGEGQRRVPEAGVREGRGVLHQGHRGIPDTGTCVLQQPCSM